MKALLAHSGVYSLFQRVIGARKFRKTLAEKYASKKGARVLDIGCGTGEILEYLPDADYTGFDINPDYVRRASEKYSRARFECRNILETNTLSHDWFDVALAIGLLHHLSDEEALSLFKLCKSVLREGGRLVTYDGCFEEGQSPVARFLLKRDRGAHVRTREAYLRLASQVFSSVRTDLSHDELRIPFTLLTMEMCK